jgi:hypothetical protein
MSLPTSRNPIESLIAAIAGLFAKGSSQPRVARITAASRFAAQLVVLFGGVFDQRAATKVSRLIDLAEAESQIAREFRRRNVDLVDPLQVAGTLGIPSDVAFAAFESLQRKGQVRLVWVAREEDGELLDTFSSKRDVPDTLRNRYEEEVRVRPENVFAEYERVA